MAKRAVSWSNRIRLSSQVPLIWVTSAYTCVVGFSPGQGESRVTSSSQVRVSPLSSTRRRALDSAIRLHLVGLDHLAYCWDKEHLDELTAVWGGQDTDAALPLVHRFGIVQRVEGSQSCNSGLGVGGRLRIRLGGSKRGAFEPCDDPGQERRISAKEQEFLLR